MRVLELFRHERFLHLIYFESQDSVGDADLEKYLSYSSERWSNMSAFSKAVQKLEVEHGGARSGMLTTTILVKHRALHDCFTDP